MPKQKIKPYGRLGHYHLRGEMLAIAQRVIREAENLAEIRKGAVYVKRIGFWDKARVIANHNPDPKVRAELQGMLA